MILKETFVPGCRMLSQVFSNTNSVLSLSLALKAFETTVSLPS